MAVENVMQLTTISAQESLDGAQYHAIAFNDGKLAVTGEEASGLLRNEPLINEHASLGVIGEMKYAAGAAIAAGGKITATTSGWLKGADSSDAIVGEAKAAVTSGSIGVGLFCFASAHYPSNAIHYAVTAAAPIVAGEAYDLSDNKRADDGEACDGISLSAISSGAAGEIVTCGITQAYVNSGTLAAGDVLTVSSGGAVTQGDSGYYLIGKAMTAVNSGVPGDIFIYPVASYLAI